MNSPLWNVNNQEMMRVFLVPDQPQVSLCSWRTIYSMPRVLRTQGSFEEGGRVVSFKGLRSWAPTTWVSVLALPFPSSGIQSRSRNLLELDSQSVTGDNQDVIPNIF